MLKVSDIKFFKELGYELRRLIPNGKTPAFKGTFDNGDSLPDLMSWVASGGNFGVICGDLSGIVVVDVDVHNGVNGLANLKAFMDKNNVALPTTRTIKTPTGGLHMFYKLPDAYKGKRFFPTLDDDIKGVDFRNNGQFIVLEGCETPNGVYTPMNHVEYKDLPEAPEWLLKLYVKPDTEMVDNDGKMTYIAKKLNDWAQPVTSGNRNNDMTQKVGFMIKQNMPIELVYTWSSIINVNFIKPPLPDNELNQIINSVLKRELLKRNQQNS